jgi:uncharacterized protein (DUF1778 family)
MPTKTKANKATRLNIRLSPSQKKLIEKAARLKSVSVSNFVLEKVVSEAQEILGQQTRFLLSPEKWEAFLAALDAPPRKQLPRLRKLLTLSGSIDD